MWLGWDPIGVTAMKDWPRDEYEAYLGPTIRLLEGSASLEKLEEYLGSVELERMGLSDSATARMGRRVFAARLREWYAQKWASSTV